MLKLRALRPAVERLPPAVVVVSRLPVVGRHTPRCWMGTHGRNEPRDPLNSPQRVKDFIYRLQPTERTSLLRELQSFESIAIAQETLEPSPPTSAQIRYVLVHNAIPFVGFGFLDNAIMIAAGTQIELSIGVTLGISTMAAAALGNLVSDLAGLGLAGYVESLVSKLGMNGPDLTPKQVDMWQTRVSSHMGKAIGVTIGCILGMFPLFFLNDDDDKEKKKKEKEKEKEAQPCSDTASHSS
ncbi:transmembrane protein 65 [Sebastes umbrosus]|uniref:transmembrane protein 65 n=1 Tax=Sebastes umbrosus TaxID=72105 RepID=UPI0018A0C812|nr:transmembrane protein 65 [Sebastes umbrosus]XP_037651561.1 transmembrane protein 65 [Sebastes umbrosus]XP_037651563.1 transmembrane protein 65 [Sebastes umbrosus]XP_037651564.1 transmembrane protein 65 [Sebastes umbrosus]